MSNLGKLASSRVRRVRTWIAALICGAGLAFGCGNGAASNPSGSASSRDAGQTESNQTRGDLPSDAGSVARVKESRVVGYLQTYRLATGEPALHLDTLTHLNLAFAIPNSRGKVDFPDADASAIQRIVDEAHKSKVKVLAAIAGASGGEATAARLAMGVDAFVASLLDLVSEYNLDGIDIDIEGDNIDPTTYGPLMQKLSKRLAELPERKLLTAAVGSYRKERYQALGTVDFLNIMSYDQCGSWSGACEHSTRKQAEDDLNYWSKIQAVDADGVSRTIGSERVVLGVPFYGRCWGKKCPGSANGDGTFKPTVDLSYAEIAAYCLSSTFSGCSDSADVLEEYGEETSGYYVSLNAPNTIESKATTAKNYGGIMIWELGQDDADGSLFGKIATEFPKGSSD